MNNNPLPGQEHELEFWKGFVTSDRFLNGWLPDDVKTPDLVQEVADFFLARPDAEVLDCGSGVVSILRGTVKAKRLTMADPLSPLYEQVFDYKKYGIAPPNPTACEHIRYKDEFDIVHISNALDHTQDPKLAYENLRRAVKPGGYLIVQGFVNEATHEGWAGMHQFNIDIVNHSLQIQNKQGGKFIVYGRDTDTAKKIRLETGREWFIFIQKKP